jgi:isocitrate/isopropylmalate dehydrogenase
MAMKNNKHIMSMGKSNVFKLSQNLHILNFTEIIKISRRLI